MKAQADPKKVIVGFILLALVLFVLIFIFKDNVGDILESFGIFTDDSNQVYEGTKCQAIFNNRVCDTAPPDSNWDLVPGEFEDCADANKQCYEKRI